MARDRTGTKVTLRKLGTEEAIEDQEPAEHQPDFFANRPVMPVLFSSGQKHPIKRACGRPVGTKNFKTKKMIQLITEQHGYPLVRLAEFANTQLGVLAEIQNLISWKPWASGASYRPICSFMLARSCPRWRRSSKRPQAFCIGQSWSAAPRKLRIICKWASNEACKCKRKR